MVIHGMGCGDRVFKCKPLLSGIVRGLQSSMQLEVKTEADAIDFTKRVVYVEFLDKARVAFKVLRDAMNLRCAVHREEF